MPTSSTPCEPQEARTFPELLHAAAQKYGEDDAVVFVEDDEEKDTISFAGIERQSAEIARGLIAWGTGKGARVGFIYGNGPEFVVMMSAIARTGAIAIPISTMIRSNELVRVLRQSDIQGLILQRTFLGKDYVRRLCDALPELLTETSSTLHIERTPYLRWVASSGADLPPAIRNITQLKTDGETISAELLTQIESEIHPADQMLEIYTSGSMALPKGVRHLHGPIMFRAKWLRDIIGVEHGQRLVAQLPMFWIGGLMMYLMPNWVAGAATLCTARTLSNNRFAMGSVLADEDLKLISGNKPYWGLGMSETLGPYSWGNEFRAEGYPVCAPLDNFAPGYDIRIADDNDQPVADGEVGMMQVRGYPVAPGLHKIENRDYFTADGYFRTGDMCLVDGKRIHFIGRDGDMIKTAGSNVSPAEVEMELQTLPEIHNAYVFGIPNKERGQLVVAALVPRDGAALDFAEIEGRMRERLSSYKVPRAYIELRHDEVPMLHSNKVSRRQLAAIVAERLKHIA